jgi:CspA family cold shock protein
MSERTIGTVKWFNSGKAMVSSQGEWSRCIRPLFRHPGDGFRMLEEGQRVEFSVEQGPKGLQAKDVVVL